MVWYAEYQEHLQALLQGQLTDQDERLWQLLEAWAGQEQANAESVQAYRLLALYRWLAAGDLAFSELVQTLTAPSALGVTGFVHQALLASSAGEPLADLWPGDDVDFYAQWFDGATWRAEEAERLMDWCREQLLAEPVYPAFWAECQAALWRQAQVAFPQLDPVEPVKIMPLDEPTVMLNFETGPEEIPSAKRPRPSESETDETPPTKRRRLEQPPAAPERSHSVRLTENDWQMVAAAQAREFSPSEIGERLGILPAAARTRVQALGRRLGLTGTTKQVLTGVRQLVQEGQLVLPEGVVWPPR